MRLSRFHVENFRGLRDVDLPISRFTCLIGENNTGKSSLLVALNLLCTGGTIGDDDYFDRGKDIRLTATFTGIDDSDLAVLAEEHRSKIAAIVDGGTLSLVRIYGSDRKSKLRYLKKAPKEPRFQPEQLDELLKGKQPSAKLMAEVVQVFPELSASVTTATKQTEYRTRIDELASTLPPEVMQTVEADLPTGIDKSVTAFLPEPIFIRAVKDLAEDMKTKDAAPFGKILRVLLDAIEGKLTEERDLFEQLNVKLNRVRKDDGTVEDHREQEVRAIEDSVRRYVQESFPRVNLEIEIPPPELKVILSSAQVQVDDGIKGDVDSKGDGLRRAVVFAVLRSFLEISQKGFGHDVEEPPKPQRNYLLLFEEPELYLHPGAQRILFEALRVFGEQHHVVFTTHSPAFLGPRSTGTFIKLTKQANSAVAKAPYTELRHVDLTEIGTKDQFQLICYENNTAAFFANTVVLVEGDSDLIVFPHIARTLNHEWGSGHSSVGWARINGKGNIRRYRDFFSCFGSRVVIIADLDLLIGGFDQLDAPAHIKDSRSELIKLLDEAISASGVDCEPSGQQVLEAQKSGALRKQWLAARGSYASFKADSTPIDDVIAAVDTFFAWERNDRRRQLLASPPNDEILFQKAKLLADLRALGVCVLDRGAIEAYYPSDIVGPDKLKKAEKFCERTATRDSLIAHLSPPNAEPTANHLEEFNLIFSCVFPQPPKGQA